MRLADLPETEHSVHVAAPPERSWPHVSDIGFAVGISPELQAVEWSDPGDPLPRVGRTFVGVNANQHFGRWQTTATIIDCEAPTRFAWAVGDPERPNTTWRFTITPADDGANVSLWLRIGPGDSGLTVAVARMPDKEERIVENRLRDFDAAMQAQLAAIKRAAEA